MLREGKLGYNLRDRLPKETQEGKGIRNSKYSSIGGDFLFSLNIHFFFNSLLYLTFIFVILYSLS